MTPNIFTNITILKNLVVQIDKKEISKEDLLTAEIFWSNSLKVSGSIIINDTFDFANLLPLNGTNEILFYAADIFDEYYFKNFVITNVTAVQYKGTNKAIEVEFLDILSYNMMNTYISKSFVNTTITDILEAYFSEYKWDDLLSTENTRTFDKTPTTFENIVVPQHQSFYDYIEYELDKEGYNLYQTRTEVILKSKDEMLPSAVDTIEYDYTQIHQSNEYGFKIFEYNNVTNNVYKLNKNMPNSEIFWYDDKTKTVTSTAVSLSDVYDSIKLNTSDSSNIQSTTGVKYGKSMTNNLRLEQKTQDAYLETNSLEIIVPGNIKHNKVYTNMKVVLSGSKFHTKGQMQGDIHSSGLYMCIGITDKIIGTKMIQKLKLIRVDYQENE